MAQPSGDWIFRRISEVANFKIGVANQLQNIGTGLKSISQSGGANFTDVAYGIHNH